MKRFRIWSTVVVFSCLGVGCSRLRPKAKVPAQAKAPTAPAAVLPDVLPAIVLQAPTAPLLLPPPTPEPEAEPVAVQPTPKKKRSRRVHSLQKKKIVTDNAEVAADNPSPMGQLSAGDSSTNPALREQTVKLIATTEGRLSAVNSSIASNKHDTISQIQGFLAQAKKALDINDLQGAQTLATKAKILVDEMLR